MAAAARKKLAVVKARRMAGAAARLAAKEEEAWAAVEAMVTAIGGMPDACALDRLARELARAAAEASEQPAEALAFLEEAAANAEALNSKDDRKDEV